MHIRLSPFILILLHIKECHCQRMFKVKGKIDKALYGYSFLNITETRMERCLAKCLENCLCMSFQMCEQEECQLCSSDKEQSPSAFRERKGCTYYAFQKDWSERGISEQCDRSCFTEINCCMTSNPCLNNGTCEAVSQPVTTQRFRCKCPAGYTGNRCQHQVSSCRGYINGSRVPGKYKVFDKDMKLFEVFCDFDSYSTMAWTLIQSYQLQNVEEFRDSFFLNHPVDQESPVWDSYRLSKSRMESIQRDSSKWRMTCQYDTDGVVYTDYIEASNDKIDILAYNNEQCMEVENIDVRRYNCFNCTVQLLQRHDATGIFEFNCPLHVDTYVSSDCFFQAGGHLCPVDGGEDNFGYYYCTNPLHRSQRQTQRPLRHGLGIINSFTAGDYIAGLEITFPKFPIMVIGSHDFQMKIWPIRSVFLTYCKPVMTAILKAHI